MALSRTTSAGAPGALSAAWALALFLSLAPAPAARADVVGELPSKVAEGVRTELLGQGNPNPPDIGDFGSLARGIVVYISGKPFLFSEDDIDRIVQLPWSLNDSTRAKLEALPPRLRFRLYSTLAGHMGNIAFQPATHLPGPFHGGVRPLRLDFDDATKNDAINGTAQALNGYFRTEELFDLLIWGISTHPYFPKDDQGWSELKTKLVRYDLGLGLIGLAALGSVSLANIDVGGWAWKTPGDTFRLGWFASARRLGFTWHPVLSAGVQGAMPNFDVSLGWKERFRAVYPNDVRSIELTVREHLLSRLSRSRHWELSALGKVRFVLDSTDVNQRGFESNLQFYARRPHLIENPQLDFLTEGAIGTDFRRTHAADLSVGLEDPVHEVAGAIRLMAGQTPLFPRELRIGLVVGGTLGGRSEIDYFRDIEDAGRRLRGAIRYAKAVERRFCALQRPPPIEEAAAEAGSDRHGGGGGLGPAADEARQRLVEFWLAQAQARLRVLSAEYADARARWRAATRRLIGPLTEEETRAAQTLPGPISAEEVSWASARLEGSVAEGARLRCAVAESEAQR